MLYLTRLIRSDPLIRHFALTNWSHYLNALIRLPSDRETEIGNIKQQDDGTQLLATLKMTQLSGVLTLVYDMLVSSFNSLAADKTTTTTPTCPLRSPLELSQLNLALHSLRLINYVAYIDIKLLQEALGADGMLPLQLRHVCSYLISHLVHSANFKALEPTATTMQPPKHKQPVHEEHQQKQQQEELLMQRDNLLKNELVNEIILLVGHFAYLNEHNQLTLKSGSRPTIIEQLIGLPFDYFSRANLQLVLMPTLVSCAHSNEQICALVSQELSLTMLTSFIEVSLMLEKRVVKSDSAKRERATPTTTITPTCLNE